MTKHLYKVPTYISAPAVSCKNLILLVEIQDLDESEAVFHFYGIRSVKYRTADFTDPFVILQQMLYEPFLVRQGHPAWK